METKLISVVTPIYNESLSIPEFIEELIAALQGFNFEIIAVNDGSSDDSWEVLQQSVTQNDNLRIINFRRNYGQTAAIHAGITHARGEIIVLIDSDLENNPKDIPKLLQQLDKGYDVVSGWRTDRWQGHFLTRKLPSILANRLISYISGLKLHDYGCTLKAYRRSFIENIQLYGQMHRFIPIYCSWQGGKVCEIPVRCRQRKFGKSNYGLIRIYKVLLDLLLINFLDRFMNRPIHFFGGFGLLSIFISMVAASVAVYFKVTGQKDFVETPLPTLTSMFLIVGILMILLGVLAEILMRTYYESQEKMPYSIKDKENFK